MQFLEGVEVGQVWKVVLSFGDAPSVSLVFKILEKGLLQISDDPTDTKFLGAKVSVLSIEGNAVPECNPVILYFSPDLFNTAIQVG